MNIIWLYDNKRCLLYCFYVSLSRSSFVKPLIFFISLSFFALLLPLLSACTDKQPHQPIQKSFTASAPLTPEVTEPFVTASSVRTAAAPFVQCSSAKAVTPKICYKAGEDPEYAKKKGWPVKYPEPLPGSILPGKRIVAYYGNPLSKKWECWESIPRMRCCSA